jgi:tight adherence protein B
VRLVVLSLFVVMVFMPRGPAPRRAPRASVVDRPWLSSGSVSALRALVRSPSVPDELASLPDLLELAARSRRAGTALLPSLLSASESVPGVNLGPALARVEAGSTLVDALDDWASSIGHADVDLVVAVLVLGDASGAAVAARLDHTSATLRRRAALADEVRALTAQTRASATVVALAPVGFALVVAATDDRFIALMLGTSIGRLSLAAGLILDMIGLWWMRRLTRIEC